MEQGMQLSDSDIANYEHIRSGGGGFIELPRGLIAVWGNEAVQFLDGMITNDIKTLVDGAQMLAAFPNAQGRLLALVRVLRQGDRFLIETEETTREKLYQSLFRFTFAGDFFVEDLSEQFSFLEIIGTPEIKVGGETLFSFENPRGNGVGVFLPKTEYGQDALQGTGARRISDELYETLRVDSGIPKYGVDMDETTIIPELGLDRMISYTKGCYVGQEIIARIHFRGHVAKQLTGLVSEATGLLPGADLTTEEGKNAGRITSVTFSPKLEKKVALAYVRFDYLAAGTKLRIDDEIATVSSLPF